jgi:hypothetical protein
MTLDDVMSALRNADAAGDTEAARQLANIAHRMQAQSPQRLREERRAEEDRIRAERRAARQQAPVEEETTFGGYFTEAPKALGRGAVNLLETAGTGISALLPDETEKSAREEIKKIAGVAKDYLAADAGYEDTVATKLFEGLGSTLPFFALGPAGLVGRAAGAGLGVAAGAGEARQSAEAEGATTEERRTATLLGAPTGLLDILAPQIKPFKSLMGTALVRGGVEGATEAAQKIAQNLIAKGVYNPEQEILVGSGEEGAYGAGVGALASLIIDMTIGRKARRAQLGLDKKPAAPETEAGPLGLGYTGTPFTPMAMPDGSVINSRDEYEQYVAGQDQNARARETDRRTSDPMAEMPADQRDLARRGKQAALEDTFAQDMDSGQMGLPGIERAGSVEVPGVGRVTGQAQEEKTVAVPLDNVSALDKDTVRDLLQENFGATFNPETGDIQVAPEDFDAAQQLITGVGEKTVDKRDVRTRDMIDELETQQIEELQAGDTSAQLRAELETKQDDAEKARLKFESDLAETDARVKNAREKGTEERRLELLLPIIDAPDVNIPQLFAKELKRNGLIPEGTEAILTPREKKLIQRAYDLRLAETPVVEDVQVEDTQTDNAGLESAIPEKDAQREPVQMGLPGMAKPKGTKPQAFSEEEIAAQEDKPFDTVLTSEVLDKTGLPKQSGFYKQLLNMDMSDPTQQPVIANIFGRVRENPNVKPATKEAVETLAMQAFGGLSKQGEMFGPRGAVLGGKPAKKETPSANKPADTGRAGAGASVGTAEAGKGKPVRATTTATKQPKAPDTDGLGADGKPASNAGVRKSDKPATVTPEAKDKPSGKVISLEDALVDKDLTETVMAESPRLLQKYIPKLKPLLPLINRATAAIEAYNSSEARIAPGYVKSLETNVRNFNNAIDTLEKVRAGKMFPEAAERQMTALLDPEGLDNFKDILSAVESSISDASGTKSSGKVVPFKKPEAKAEPKKTEPAKTETKAEPKKAAPTPVQGENAYQMSKDQGEGDYAVRVLAADAYLNTAEDYSVKKAEAMLRDLNDGKMPDLKFGKDNANGPGTGGKYAKAFYDSLDTKEKAAFVKALQRDLYELIAGKAYLEAYNRSQAIAREEFDGDVSALATEAKGISIPLHPEVVRMVENNDLIGALKYIGSMGTGRIPALAKRFAALLNGVDIGVMDFNNPSADMQKIANATNTNLAGNSGVYLTNNKDIEIILLDSNTGLDVWSLLHEASHAVTNATLSNPSHPLTKQLTQLFDDVEKSLGTAYGARDVKEFSSEAFSNPVFRQALAGINPKGEKITALRRFVHAVKNFLRSLIGLDTKSLNSALDATDYLLEAIVQGHGSESVSGDSPVFTASLLNKGESLFKAIDQRTISLPAFNNETAAGILDFLRTTAPAAIKKVVLRGLPLNALTVVASKDVPMAPTLARLEKEWNGAVAINRNAIEATWVNIKKWGKGNPEKLQALDTTIMESTLARVDPSKDRSNYVGKTDDSGNKLDEAWDRLQPDWKKLEDDGQAIYVQMRDSYAAMHQKLIDQILTRIDESVGGDVAKTLKKEILARLATKGKIEPYFPLAREGEYRISYNAKGPAGNMERYVEHYANAVTRDRAALTLEAGKTPAEIKAMNIETFKGFNLNTYRDAPSSSFMNKMVSTMAANSVSNETIEEVMRAYQDALPEAAFAQAFRTRKDIRGANTNSTQVFYDRSLSMSYQMAGLEYASKMYKLRDEIKEHVLNTNRSDEARLMAEELTNHIQTLVRPEVAGWSKALTSAAFGWTLGFNVSSTLVNTSQIPLVIMPYLGGKYGYGKTTTALGQATKLFFGSGMTRTAKMTAPLSGKDTYTSRGAFSLDNYDFDAKGTPKEVKRLKELSELSVKYGLLDRSMTNDLLESGPKSTVLDTINKYSGFIFHHGERMNRQVTLVASYNLELDRMAKEQKIDIDALTSAERTAAAEEAVRLAELLNGGASAGSAPLLAKNSIGKVIFMYKRYGASMYYMMYRTAKEAMKSESSEVRNAAMRQILGIYVSAGVLAGVQGLPMAGMAMMIWNLFRDDDEDDAETMVRKYFDEGVYSGALNYLLGVNVASRIGLTDLLIADTGYKSQDGVLMSTLAAAGGPVYGVGTRIGDGVKMIYEGEFQRGIEKILPTGFSNAMKSIRYATEGANTMRGDPIVGEMSYANAAGQFFGFAPAEYTRQLEINANVKGIDRAVNEKKTKLLRKYYMAMRMGDTVAGDTIMEDMRKFSERHPGVAITIDTILKSMKQHARTSATMYSGITLSKGMMSALMANIAEYEGEDEDE